MICNVTTRSLHPIALLLYSTHSAAGKTIQTRKCRLIAVLKVFKPSTIPSAQPCTDILHTVRAVPLGNVTNGIANFIDATRTRPASEITPLGMFEMITKKLKVRATGIHIDNTGFLRMQTKLNAFHPVFDCFQGILCFGLTLAHYYKVIRITNYLKSLLLKKFIQRV